MRRSALLALVFTARFAFALVFTACVAPPLGIGTGARLRSTQPTTASPPDMSTLAGNVGVGLAPNREIVQLDASVAHRFGPHFALEYGAALTQVGVAGRPSIPVPPPIGRIEGERTEVARAIETPEKQTGTLVGIGVLPYVRPRFQLGRLSIALAACVLAGGGGEEGAIGMFADSQIGVGGERWSIYAGGYGLAYIDSFGTFVRAAQARVGAELFASSHVGVAVEAFTGMDSIQLYEEAEPTPLSFTGAAIKLRIER